MVRFVLMACVLVVQTGWSQTPQDARRVRQNNVLTRIAFGSCSDERKPQPWSAVVREHPQLWIWLGDNVYADTDNMATLQAAYDKQKSDTAYQRLIATTPVIGTWDDHDYGLNDGGKEYTQRQGSKAQLLRFLGTPANDAVHQHEGIYNSHTYGTGKRKVKVILLDTRYFRDALTPDPTKQKRYIPGPGDMLGETQWQWLEHELRHSDAALHIIGSSIQFISEQHGFEKWANLPESYSRLTMLLRDIKPKGTFIISGDRHIAELARLDVDGLPYPLYDFTSSGLTHTWESGWEENKYRVGDMVRQKNFGMILIDWSGNTPTVTFQVKGLANETYFEHTVRY